MEEVLPKRLLMVSIFKNAVSHGSYGWRELVSAKSVKGLELGLVRSGPSLVGRPLYSSCTNTSRKLYSLHK